MCQWEEWRGGKRTRGHWYIVLTARVEVKLYLYWPRQARRVPGGSCSQTSRQSAHEVDKAVSPTQRPPLHPGNITGTHSSSYFANKANFYSEQLPAPRPKSKLEDHLLSVVRDCLFNIFAATVILEAVAPSVTRRRVIYGDRDPLIIHCF